MLSTKRLIPLPVGMAVVLGVLAVMQITGSSGLPGDSREAEEFRGITRWLNSEPLTLEEMRGRVVLVDFWTYSCINCQRTLPYLRGWNDQYSSKGLTIVGVHTPEFEFEKVESNVRQAVVREGIAWPVAMDNDFGTWRAYQTQWWPHKFLIDHKGVIRHQQLGEGGYQEMELQIRNLLIEAGYDLPDIPVGGVDVVKRPGATTWEVYAGLGWSPRKYLGNDRKDSSISGPAGEPIRFIDPGHREDSRFYLHGVWTLNEQSVRHGRRTEGFEDYIAIQYREASVSVVLQPDGREPLNVEVTLDLEPVPDAMRGDDILVDSEGRTFLVVDTPRLYSIIRSSLVDTHELRLSVASPDLSLYNFTFGARRWTWETLDEGPLPGEEGD